ncbi:MAG: hypothetical protein QNJ33_04540 [Crocosphaera sp.]|nr:hypothetical protein [Crocosphaera sp.]
MRTLELGGGIRPLINPLFAPNLVLMGNQSDGDWLGESTSELMDTPFPSSPSPLTPETIFKESLLEGNQTNESLSNINTDSLNSIDKSSNLHPSAPNIEPNIQLNSEDKIAAKQEENINNTIPIDNVSFSTSTNEFNDSLSTIDTDKIDKSSNLHPSASNIEPNIQLNSEDKIAAKQEENIKNTIQRENVSSSTSINQFNDSLSTINTDKIDKSSNLHPSAPKIEPNIQLNSADKIAAKQEETVNNKIQKENVSSSTSINQFNDSLSTISTDKIDKSSNLYPSQTKIEPSIQLNSADKIAAKQEQNINNNIPKENVSFSTSRNQFNDSLSTIDTDKIDKSSNLHPSASNIEPNIQLNSEDKIAAKQEENINNTIPIDNVSFSTSRNQFNDSLSNISTDKIDKSSNLHPSTPKIEPNIQLNSAEKIAAKQEENVNNNIPKENVTFSNSTHQFQDSLSTINTEKIDKSSNLHPSTPKIEPSIQLNSEDKIAAKQQETFNNTIQRENETFSTSKNQPHESLSSINTNSLDSLDKSSNLHPSDTQINTTNSQIEPRKQLKSGEKIAAKQQETFNNSIPRENVSFSPPKNQSYDSLSTINTNSLDSLDKSSNLHPSDTQINTTNSTIEPRRQLNLGEKITAKQEETVNNITQRKNVSFSAFRNQPQTPVEYSLVEPRLEQVFSWQNSPRTHHRVKKTVGRLSVSSPPTVEVKIGRIEVRRVTPPSPPPSRSRPGPAKPQLSLENYLKQRNGEEI